MKIDFNKIETIDDIKLCLVALMTKTYPKDKKWWKKTKPEEQLILCNTPSIMEIIQKLNHLRVE